MPQIQLQRDLRCTYIKRANTENRKLRQSIYQTQRWRSLRLAYLQEHPLCESCLERGLIVPSEQVHHRDSFIKYKSNINAMLERAYDYNNLQALCATCHSRLHANEQKEKRYGKRR